MHTLAVLSAQLHIYSIHITRRLGSPTHTRKIIINKKGFQRLQPRPLRRKEGPRRWNQTTCSMRIYL
jgi:hypothetical protein